MKLIQTTLSPVLRLNAGTHTVYFKAWQAKVSDELAEQLTTQNPNDYKIISRTPIKRSSSKAEKNS